MLGTGDGTRRRGWSQARVDEQMISSVSYNSQSKNYVAQQEIDTHGVIQDTRYKKLYLINVG